jgi:type IV pilus assembly protein PilC
MLFSKRLSLPTLIELCRVLRHYLASGLTLRDVFLQEASKGPLSVRPIAGRVAASLEKGNSLEDAIKPDAAAFPPLFLSLTSVGEKTGMLPEVFGELEKYFARQLQLKRQFIAQSAWPMIQFFLAIFVVAGLIFIMGMLPTPPKMPTGKPFDPVGLGLAGPSGAMTFLGWTFGILFGMIGLYLLLTRVLKQRTATDRFLLQVPALGPCLRTLALARFCLALRLTTETGMSINRALRLSMRATGNNAFIAVSPVVESEVRSGTDLTVALTRARIFPGDFLKAIHVAEESGRLADQLRHQADHYHEESGRRLSILTSAAGYAVWFVVGALIVIAIFRIALTYLNVLESVS